MHAKKTREQIACCVRGRIVATMQLFANYSRGTENRKALKACTVAVKTDDLSDTELKVVTRLPRVTCWYRRCRHAQNN